MISELIREDLKELMPYQQASLVSEIPYIRLHANESPWSVSDTYLNRYPKQLSTDNAARYYGVEPNELLVTRGSNEGIDVLLRLFCKSGSDEVLIVTPTFGMYSVMAQIQGVSIKNIALEERSDFAFEVEKIINNLEKKTKLIFICTPNNPTGNSMLTEDIERLCKACDNQSIVVIDEAYIEFSEQKSSASLIRQYKNLVVLRTMSKAFGMAGVRAGFVLAQGNLIRALQSIMPPYTIPSPCVQLIEDAFSTEKIVQMWINTMVIKNSREYLRVKLEELGIFEKVYPSDGNYLLLRLTNAEKIQRFMQEKGLLLRKIEISSENSSNKNNIQYASQSLAQFGYLRVSVGSYEENQKLIEALTEWEQDCEK